MSSSASPVTGAAPEQACEPHQPRQLNPAEQRARSRTPPLVEYAASGSYVIISSQEGELSLVPDSREWFDWLATLSSFRGCRANRAALPRIEETVVAVNQVAPGRPLVACMVDDMNTVWGSLTV